MRKRPFTALLAGLKSDQDAAVGPMIALLGSSLLAVAGLALDVGLYQLGNRDLRAATEAAALAAAMNPAQAQSRAADYLTRNGYDAAVLQSVTVGRYCADGHAGSTARFRTSPAPCADTAGTTSVYNAVRIQTRKPSRRFLTGILGGSVVVPDLASTATAARIDEAGVEISTGLLTVTNPLVNTINNLLGSLIGVQLRLSTAEVEAMMGGNVDAGMFFDKLAQRSGQTGTYGELVNQSHGIADIANAAADAANKPSTAAALRAFASQAGNGYRVPLKDLFGLGVWQNMPVGEGDAKPALRAGMNAYQLISYAVQSGPTVVDLSSAIGLLVPASTVKIGLVTSGAADRPRFSFGPAGDTKVFTSALRLQVLVDLPVNIPLIASVNVHLPILVDVAAGRADVNAINCQGTGNQLQDTTVGVTATTGEVNAYIGDTAFNPMTKAMPEVNAGHIQRATIAKANLLGIINLVDIKGSVVAQPVAGVTNASMTFGPGVADPSQPKVPQTIGNQVALGQTISTLTTGLLKSNGLTIELLGTCLPIVCSTGIVTTLVRNVVLPAVITPVTDLLGNVVDPLLNNVLSALGVQLGHATVWVNGARCGVPVLV